MTDYTTDERFDGFYMNVVQTTQGVEPLLDTMFSFLRRKTDFFKGPPRSEYQGSEQAEQNGRMIAVQTIQHVLQKHANLYVKDLQMKNKKEKDAKKKTEEAAAKKKKQAEEAAAKKKIEEEAAAAKNEAEQSTVVEMGNSTTNDTKDKEQQQTSSSQDNPNGNDVEDKTKDSSEVEAEDGGETDNNDEKTDEEKDDDDGNEKDDSKKKEEKKGPPPVGNGGTVDGKYVWTQTMAEVVVHVPVPDNTRGKEVNVVITKKHLKVGLQKDISDGGTWIMNAPLTNPIKCDDSIWMIEDGNRLVLTLQKVTENWWERVVVGDPKIDTSAIPAEETNLSEYDDATRQKVEQMMYDQRQKALGLPTTEDDRKQKMLQTFKEHHPDMDLSNATIS